MKDIEHWVKVLCEEAYDRIESDRELNKRVAQQLVVGHNSSSGQHTKVNIFIYSKLILIFNFCIYQGTQHYS